MLALQLRPAEMAVLPVNRRAGVSRTLKTCTIDHVLSSVLFFLNCFWGSHPMFAIQTLQGGHSVKADPCTALHRAAPSITFWVMLTGTALSPCCM